MPNEEVVVYDQQDDNGLPAPLLGGDQIVMVAAQAEKRIDAMKKIKIIALKVTNDNDWVDQGGKPYLQVSGAEKVARVFGISWTLDEPKYESEESGHFTYTYKGRFAMGGAAIEAVGVRSSKDQFFCTRRGKWNEESGRSEKITIPPSEIDRGDLKKAALTNCLGNGITRLLGLRNLTWAELNAAGIKAASKVSYDKNKGKGNRREPPPADPAPPVPNDPAKEHAAAVIKAIDTWAKKGVTQSQLEMKLKASAEKWTDLDLVQLRELYGAINSGQSTVEKMFSLEKRDPGSEG